MDNIPIEDKKWLAALMDAEGTIGMYYYKHKNENRISLQCTITNTALSLLEEVIRITKQGKIRFYRPCNNPKNKIAMKWYISKKSEIKKFLDLISPYLIIKQTLAVIMKMYCELPHFYGKPKLLEEKRTRILEAFEQEKNSIY